MAFFLKGVLGGPSTENESAEDNVAEMVENFVERIETSTLLEDRRDAVRGLKSLSKNYQLEVGAQGMDALFSVLQNDSDDSEIVELALDAFNNVICNEEANQDLCAQFTEIFIKRNTNVQIVLDLLPEFDFKIRWPAIKLILGLLKNKLRKCQDCILTHPMGIPRMMDLLVDPREVIRNDALLLLMYLTKNNANIQKIVAFENAFDRILEIISTESFSDGGVVVEDCLGILLNLLNSNTSNQNYFKEGNYLQRLIPFFDIPFDVIWSSQKISNILLMFKVIRSLVSPSNPLQVTNSCQKLMNQNGVLQKLCVILLSNGIPAQVLTETINTVAEVIRGNQQNQEYFSRVNAPIQPPRPVLVILLMSMINEKQPFDLRSSVLYCFQSFLFKNELGQAQVVETLLPSSAEQQTPEITAGQLLCSGLFVNDVLTNWYVSVALSHAVVSNITQKEQLLRVQLAIDASGSTTSLLAYVSSILRKAESSAQKRIAALMMLSMWLSDSPLAVANFLTIPQNIPYLTAQVGLLESSEPVEKLVQGLCAFLIGTCICFNNNSVPSLTKDDLCKLIHNRIGVDIFTEKLESISKHEKYNQALQRPQMSYTDKEDVLFDYAFCNLFKLQEPTILRIVQKFGSANNENSMNAEEHKMLVEYKELIRKQDTQLVTMGKQLTALQLQNEQLTAQLNESRAISQQMQDQLTLLRNQNGSQQQFLTSQDQAGVEQQLRQHIDALNYQISVRDHNLTLMTNQLTQMTNDGKSNGNDQNSYLLNENRRLQSIIDQYANYYAAFNSEKTTQNNDSTDVAVASVVVPEPVSFPEEEKKFTPTTDITAVNQTNENVSEEAASVCLADALPSLTNAEYSPELLNSGHEISPNGQHEEQVSEVVPTTSLLPTESIVALPGAILATPQPEPPSVSLNGLPDVEHRNYDLTQSSPIVSLDSVEQQQQQQQQQFLYYQQLQQQQQQQQ